MTGRGQAEAVLLLVNGNRSAGRTALDLAARLDGSAGMAGDDSTATQFASSYDEAAAVSLAALGSLVGAFAALGHLVEASLVNHGRAEARATLDGWAAPLIGPATAADQSIGVALADPPSSLGAASSRPDGVAGIVLDLLQGVFWPTADTDRLRAAASAWTGAADSLHVLTARCDSAVGALDGERSPEIPLATAVIHDVRDRIGDLSAQLASLGSACSSYADQVDAKRHEMLDLLEGLAVELGIGALVLGGVSFLSGGAATGLAGGAAAARIASASSRFRSILESLRILSAGPALEVRPVAVGAGRVGGRFSQISEARVLLMDAGEGGAARSTGGRSSAFLRAEDEAGGHVRIKHVGKSDTDLLDRLRNEPQIPHASSFRDEKSAERFIKDLLAKRSSEIESWLEGGRRRLRLEHWVSETTGRSAGRDGTVLDVSGLRVLLARAPERPSGFRIVTAFPQP